MFDVVKANSRILNKKLIVFMSQKIDINVCVGGFLDIKMHPSAQSFCPASLAMVQVARYGWWAKILD